MNDSSSEDYDNECAIDELKKDQEVINAEESVKNDSINGDIMSTNSYKLDEMLKNKIFSLEGIERREKLFYLNLIHYDENMKNSENIDYYKRFKLNVVGGFHGIDNFEIFKQYMEAMKKNPNKIHYVLVTSGSASAKILSYCHDFEFINEIIIFCMYLEKYTKMYDKNTELGKKYYKLKLISADYSKVEDYLSEKKFDKAEIDMDKQLSFTPIITYYEYQKAYFSVHRLISYFFDENWGTPKYETTYINKIKNCLNQAAKDINEENKKLIKDTVNKLKKSKNFGVEVIQSYTGEGVCYILNKIMRDISKGYIELTYFFGPYDYGFFKFLHDNPDKGINKTVDLTRNIKLNPLDFYTYTLSEKEIICFPSFTSTSLKLDNTFSVTCNGKEVNNIDDKDCINVKMIFHYIYEKDCISPGIDVSSDAVFKGEKEVLLLPFTFVKFNKIEKKDDKNYIFDFTIINRKKILEFELRNKGIDDIKKNMTKLVLNQ